MFFVVVIGIWTVLHSYLFWRISRLPQLKVVPGWLWWAAASALWLSYPIARYLDRNGFSMELARIVELIGANWIGVLFLQVVFLLAADLLTAFTRGYINASSLRVAAMLSALVLAAVGLVQGNRPPVVEKIEVPLSKLPPELEGLRVVQLSDLHLGTILGETWLSRRVAQVLALRPDIVVITGDLIDSNARHVEHVLPELQKLTAPYGVFAVTGNHEHYAGVERSVALFRQAGFHVLRDENFQVRPGLVIAGVDDLTARRQFGVAHQALTNALQDRSSGACILLSHTPWQVSEAAAMGVDLMLAGHTHGGQIWPFSYLVALSYPQLQGTFRVGGLTLHVSRGTGTWGPRMRLWQAAEVTLLVLRAEKQRDLGR